MKRFYFIFTCVFLFVENLVQICTSNQERVYMWVNTTRTPIVGMALGKEKRIVDMYSFSM